MRKLLISENVFDGEKYIGAAGIVVEGEKIEGVVPYDAERTGMEVVDFGKALLIYRRTHTFFLRSRINEQVYVYESKRS